jgi:tRNA/rRNA methyltransferase
MNPRWNVRLILVEPQGPVNLGACARLCENFSVEEWVLVKPQCGTRDPDAICYATGPSAARLDSVRVVASLAEALEGTHLSVGFCGKIPGRKGPPAIDLPELAAYIGAGEASAREARRIALVFGNERVGLSFDDLIFCSRHCNIPTGAFDSLNLSHAVAVVLARLFEAGHIAAPALETSSRIVPASHQEIEAMYAHGREFLAGLGYVRAGNPDRILLLFRRMLDRAGLRANEVKALRSIFSQVLGRLRYLGSRP